ncbi:OmpA family protein [Pollutibacter soli]|uniref:OmpA family protein n=1 Tax=Pollutibacter soli TaxID=3034157 RepID=UPI0030140C7C
MKKVIALQLLLFISYGLFAQSITKGRYTTSAGLLGAANYGNFRTGGNNPQDLKFNMKFGWSAGAWVNFPLTNFVSLEPQLLYSQYSYEPKQNVNQNMNGYIGYISVPLLFKLHVSEKFAITVGPQLDIKQNVSDKNNLLFEDDFDETSVAATAGVEFNPHGRLAIFARYLYGLNDFNKPENSGTSITLYNQQIQAGLKLKLFGRFIPADSDGDGIPDPKDKCPQQVGLERYQGCPIPDTDNDGVNDEQDKCPTVAGLPKYEGCPVPDTDKDGVNDEQDKCPTVAGLAKYNGCPIPDTDGDGINDEEDKCPTQAGVAKYQGCPVPDTDGDGINDDDDRCPTVAGVPEMKGCPKIATFQAHEVTFATGKSVLTASGKKELDVVVDFLQKNADVKIKLEGYTDNTGTDKVNNPLSLNRAAAAEKYLMSKGIADDRIMSEGFGSANPVGDNKTAKGRALNRRVEVKVQ